MGAYQKISGLIRFFLLFLILIPSPVSGAEHQLTVSGKTMGTTYTVKLILDQDAFGDIWKKRIDTCLERVNAAMSMFDSDSELSRFNRQPVNQPFSMSRDFSRLLAQAHRLYTLTDGSWDGSVKPLVDLWGFGVMGRISSVPSPDLIHKTLLLTGFDKIRRIDDWTVVKTAPVFLDLGSVAKGFGVDAVKNMLSAFSVRHCLVEIGGELSASGKNIRKEDWAVGITRPETRMARQSVFHIIRLDDMAVATSGDYRNFFEDGGKVYSHIIDPGTGCPVDNGVVSATVIHPSCAFADGLATALMVTPVKKGIELVNQLDDTECLIIRKDADGFHVVESEGLHQLSARPSSVPLF